MVANAEAKLRELGIELPRPAAPNPDAPPPVANLVPVVRTGNLLFLSGTIGSGPNGERLSGKLGAEYGVDEGYAAARQAAIGLLGRVRDEAGSLDRVRRIVKVLGFVNSAPDFTDQPRVVNGASDLLVEVFGEAGRHARSAIGVASLPGGAPVEVEMVVEVEA
jgi:enamine deaminase RidA (YjgF/YER057c/UK114 family)